MTYAGFANRKVNVGPSISEQDFIVNSEEIRHFGNFLELKCGRNSATKCFRYLFFPLYIMTNDQNVITIVPWTKK